MVRARRGGAYAADWLDRNVIGNGWDFDGVDIANMSRKQTREARQTRLPAGPRYCRRAANSNYPMSTLLLPMTSCETGMSASSSYLMAALCLSSSESTSFVRAPETMS